MKRMFALFLAVLLLLELSSASAGGYYVVGDTNTQAPNSRYMGKPIPLTIMLKHLDMNLGHAGYTNLDYAWQTGFEPEITTGLEMTRKEGTLEQVIVENMLSYLKVISPNTDAEIASGLMVSLSKEEIIPGAVGGEIIVDLGLIRRRNVQGRLLGYLVTSDGDNLVLFLGIKDTNRERFITAVRIPLYVMEDSNTPFKFSIDSKKSLVFGSHDVGATYERTKERDVLTGVLDNNINRNVVVNLYTDIISKADLNSTKNYGVSTFVRYVNEMIGNIYCSRSLDFSVYRNGIDLEFDDSEYTDHKVDIWETNDVSAINDNLFKVLLNGAVDNVPIILGMAYTTID